MKKILNTLTVVALMSSISLSAIAQTSTTPNCAPACPPVKAECPCPTPTPKVECPAPKEVCPPVKVECPCPTPTPKVECPAPKEVCPAPKVETKKKKNMFQRMMPYKN